MNDQITVTGTTPDIASALACVIPARNCITIAYSPDNYLVSAPTKFGINIIPDPIASNFIAGDRVVITIANGQEYEFLFVGAGLSTGLYEIEVGATAIASCQAIGLALQQIGYINLNYYVTITGSGFSMVAIEAGSEWTVGVSTNSSVFYFLPNIIAAGDIATLNNYRICTEVIELLEDCPVDIYGNLKKRLIGTYCKWAEPNFGDCPPVVRRGDYTWSITTDIAPIATQLFDVRVPKDCSDGNFTLHYMQYMMRKVMYRYYSDRVDRSGYNQEQNYFDGSPFYVADIAKPEITTWAAWWESLCQRRQPISVQQTLLDYMTCLSTCHSIVVYLDVAAPTAIQIDVRWFVGGVLHSNYALTVGGTASTSGFYEIPFTMQELYNLSYIASGGLLPSVKFVTTFDIQVLGGVGVSAQRLRWGYDHRTCCRLQCTNYILFCNELGGNDTLAVQCHVAEFAHIGEEFCRLDSCEPNKAADDKWATDGLTYNITLWSLPEVVRDVTGILNTQDQGVERLIRSFVQAGMGWMPINGLLRKCIVKDVDYDRLKKCHSFKCEVVY